MKSVLVTGCGGFIGWHIGRRLLDEGYHVVGIDNINNYYDVSLKNARLNVLNMYEKFRFLKTSLEDSEAIRKIFTENSFSIVLNLAGQAGVRYSAENPFAYISSNLVGFFNILEGCRCQKVEHLIYASSSSVYGANSKVPFSVHDNADHPVSLYAATKKSNEMMAHVYSYLHGIPTTGLRFFTVYGPWGRPDMAYFLFTKAILDGKPIKVFNGGEMKRDFTYIDDIVEGVYRLMHRVPAEKRLLDRGYNDPSSSMAPYKIYNIGNSKPVKVLDLIMILENQLGRKAQIEFLPLQVGEVFETFADINDLIYDTGFEPRTSLQEGISEFIKWYKGYYNIEL